MIRRAVARLWPSAWPRDDVILFSRFESNGSSDMFSMAPDANATPQTYLASPWSEMNATLSPDGALAAYEAREGDRFEIWLRDFPSPKGKWKVSNGGGSMPRWSPDGGYIYFWDSGPTRNRLMRAQVVRTPSVAVRAPERVVELDRGLLLGSWDLHPDGTRFILSEPVRESPTDGAQASARARHLLHLNFFTTLVATVKPGS